ncbi:MAG: enoyl-ACP reductase FabI [Sulfitobacter sp.]|nr:enoyl-ACP reductase FabI [Sulfitobacter sp.]
MNNPTLAPGPVRLLDMTGKKGLIVGVANQHSLAWAAARNCHAAGADLALTYLNDKARPFVEPLAESLGAPLFLPCDVAHEGELEAVFATINETWGKLDFLVHAIAWAPATDLHGRLTDCSAEGFAQAMQVSCHSFIRMAKLSEPLMAQGGSLTTLSFIGAERVVDHYSLMGPVKAALEASVRYLAHELGPKGIRVNAISAGAIKTRAASGIEHFDELIRETETKSPLRRTVTADEVGRAALLLASDHTTAITGEILHVDAGFHVDGMVFH